MGMIEITRRSFGVGVGALAVSSLTFGKAHAFVAKGYPIASDVFTTVEHTIKLGTEFSDILPPTRLNQVQQYSALGYGSWTLGDPLPIIWRDDLVPGLVPSQHRAKLLRFFTISDVHITDKERPAQLIYLQQLFINVAGQPEPVPEYCALTSVYSPTMLYTTHVLDAAVQTINALHRKESIDFGLALGDVCDSTQYNETRWFIDVMDGHAITPSSGDHLGANTVDYQRPYKAAGLNASIPWYQVLGNHDHFWMGSYRINNLPNADSIANEVSQYLKSTMVGDTVLSSGTTILTSQTILQHKYYMGFIDGSSPYGNIKGIGSVNGTNPPKVTADSGRRSLSRQEWISEFFNTTSNPIGHGFDIAHKTNGFACYSFLPKAGIPLKIIVLDDTQRDDDLSARIHGHGCLDQQRYEWLKAELQAGQDADQLMVIAAHIPICVNKPGDQTGWWDNKDPAPIPPDPGYANAVTQDDLIIELQKYPNFILWLAGHRHKNTVSTPIVSTYTNGEAKRTFWQVETCSLRDFPQQFRMFDLYSNLDDTISIVTTNVDPAVREGTPAARSRSYAVASAQILSSALLEAGFDLYDSANPPVVPGNGAHYMPTGSYNAELVVSLTPKMQQIIKSCGTPVSSREQY
jgi:metallophosphoesterase (TIGR03768 family)